MTGREMSGAWVPTTHSEQTEAAAMEKAKLADINSEFCALLRAAHPELEGSLPSIVGDLPRRMYAPVEIRSTGVMAAG